VSDSDPFGTAGLRQVVLQAWESSPTRFREDANTEEDLRLGGYREGLLVELAQNAADAAGSDGILWVRLDGRELCAANTGAALTAEGVASLAALRASAKRTGTTIGRFGVGFAAVLAVTGEPSVISTSGGVLFSARRTREAVAELPGPAEELALREGAVPVLRLPWPVSGTPPEGFATEVRLPLLTEVDASALLAAFTDQAADLLLALPGLSEIRIEDQSWRRGEPAADRVVIEGPHGSQRWLSHRVSGELGDEDRSDLGAEARPRTQWWLCWAVPVDSDDAPAPRTEDVLHAPTPTEERLSLPARLLASVPLEADRRRVATSAAVDRILRFAGECYPALVEMFPPEHRAELVPLPGFPASDVDDKLRRAVLRSLRDASWLPAADGGTVPASRARVLDQFSPELVELLREVIPGLLSAELSAAAHRRALATLEVPRLGAAELVEASTGLRRPAAWWRRLYDALSPFAEADPAVREELSALPVPLVDGRTAIGARDVLVSTDDPDLVSALDIPGLRVVDPEAAHPLLERLGAHRAGAGELLDSLALDEAVRNSLVDAHAGASPVPLAEAVLNLVRHAGGRQWLSALALPDEEGEFRRADELLLPDAALREVLDPRVLGNELSVLDAEFARRWPNELLRSIGVVDGFVVVEEEEPSGPDERFPRSDQWWDEQEATRETDWPPALFVGVRDLDLVADDSWPAALRLLAHEPRTRAALRDPRGYVAWWISRFALLAGRPPSYWRLPDADELAGLYDPLPDVGLDSEVLRLCGVRGELRVDDTEDAVDLVARLGDRDRDVRAGTALRAHRVLADAVARGLVDLSEADPPELVRSLSGAVVSTERAAVLDKPWFLDVLDVPLLVAGGGPADFDAGALAELLDLPLASQDGPFPVDSAGQVRDWSEVSRVSAACELLGVPVPDSAVTVHEVLRVRTSDGTQRVHWWVDDAGPVHAQHSPDGLARALAWSAGRWERRFALIALLTDPDAKTLLR
jgi:hypothetical protein